MTITPAQFGFGHPIGAELRLIAFVTATEPVQRILTHLGRPAEPPRTGGVAGRRQSAYQLRQCKKRYRQVQRLKHSTSQDPEKRAAKLEDERQAHRACLQQAEALLTRVRETRVHLVVCRVPVA